MNTTLRELNGQIRSHPVEPYHRNQEYEASRRAQACTIAELQNRERAQQDDRMRTIQEMKELKEICCVLKLREFKNHERMKFPETHGGEVSPQ